MRRNYDTKLSASNLSGEIITGNYELLYYVAENVGIIAFIPKLIKSVSKQKRYLRNSGLLNQRMNLAYVTFNHL